MKKALTVVPGSILDVAKKEGKTLAHVFALAEVIAICDVSGSMGSCDSRDGQFRYDVLRQELADLQIKYPGGVAVCAFSDEVAWIPNGEPPYYGDGTDMAKALRFAKTADIEGRTFFVISDGQPDDLEATLAEVRKYTCVIHTIFVGPVSGWGSESWQACLARISQESGGKHGMADRVVDLADKVVAMLPARVTP